MSNENLPEPDFDYDDSDEIPGDPDYYMCNCCGYSCREYHGNWGCPRCTAIMEPEYY